MLTKFQLKALSQILKKDLSGLSLGICEIKDGELWHEPVSFHPWKERVYTSQPTGILVDTAMEFAMNLLAEKLAKNARAEAETRKSLEKANNELHNSMVGKSWTHLVKDDEGSFEIEITVDGLGWKSGGCFGTFPRDVQTEEEAVKTISSMAEGETLYAMEE